MGILSTVQSSFAVQIPLMLVGYVGLLYFNQDRMVYHPSRYSKPLEEVPDFDITPFNFQTELGEQGAYIMRFSESTSVSRIYLAFGGNAMVARNWIQVLHVMPKAVVNNTAFVLVDYPGFGESEGGPSSAAILQSAKEAVKWALQDLEADLQEDVQLGAIGHSIGCSVALHLAVEQLAEGAALQHLVLSACFTTLTAMAKALLPVLKPVPDSWIAALTSRHAWNNLEAAAMLAGDTAPRISMMHGTSDEIVPTEMGRQLFEQLKTLSINVTFEDTPAGHNDLLSTKEYRAWVKKAFG
mmetsp:Transcript_5413/g.9068  ORF Transcript_5413/g.9068 Transcript_5413/m.9068 type:complete len:297 (-) Transcript_5413:2-892(-)